MVINLRNILIFITIILFNLQLVSANTITYSADYGLENILLAGYLIFNLFIWFYIYLKTEPFKINEKSLLNSAINNAFRGLSYLWFFVIFYMSRAVLFISSANDYLETKLFIFNLLYLLTFILLIIFGLCIFIKYSSTITGLKDFLERVVYEVKNGE